MRGHCKNGLERTNSCAETQVLLHWALTASVSIVAHYFFGRVSSLKISTPYCWDLSYTKVTVRDLQVGILRFDFAHWTLCWVVDCPLVTP